MSRKEVNQSLETGIIAIGFYDPNYRTSRELIIGDHKPQTAHCHWYYHQSKGKILNVFM